MDDNEVAQLFFKVIDGLRKQGVAILFVSHFLDQVYEISDRMTVLRNGKLVGEYLTADLPRVELISKMIGKDMGALREPNTAPHQRFRQDRGTPKMKVLGLEQKRECSKQPTSTSTPGTSSGLRDSLGSGRTDWAADLRR